MSVAPAEAPPRARDARPLLPPSRPPRTRRVDLAVMLFPTALLAALGWHRRWMTDDGLIFTRVVRQIAAGHGPVYSVGERVETSTSTLWPWLLAAAHWVTPFRDAETGVYLGLALSVGGMWLALDATRRLHRVRTAQRFLLPVGALVFVAIQVNWDFLTAGMEMGLVLAWIGAAWWLLVAAWRRPAVSRPRLAAAAFLYGLGPMVRPDLGLTALVLLGTLAWLARARWRACALMAAAAGALPATYQVFRMGYYGLLV
ncbi:MAG: hypothetical protein HOV68_08375, partial [Streptomycetaceae bacterium]|nr:hypothetical protein [Streptomycetaceae bacterium]